jgi:hypothetical protein
MKQISYKLIPTVTEDIIQSRYSCYNEKLHYYKDIEASREDYDKVSFHLPFFIDGVFAGATRLTPCPHNWMNIANGQHAAVTNDQDTLEIGRTFVLPEYRGIKLVSLILIVATHIAETMGYKKVIGTETCAEHIKMPSDNGWEFMDVITDFERPFSNNGPIKMWVIQSDLIKSHDFRQFRIGEFKKWFESKGYLIDLY